MIPESEWTAGQREFIGTTFPTPKGGVLTVTGVVGKRGSHAVFTLECSVCSKDKELFLDGFTSLKGGLVKGRVPCGCAFNPKWSQPQYETLINRKCFERGYEFLGFVGEWNGAHTYLRLHNLSNGNTWESANINSFFSGRGCPLEGRANADDKRRTPQAEREQKVKGVLKIEGGEFIGWIGEYKGKNSRFKWSCSQNHPCETSVDNFLNSGNRCPSCKKIKQREDGVGYGYYHKRTQEQDNLYIIHFKKGGYIKVGRSFDVERRVKKLIGLSKHKRKEIEILAIYTGRHQDVYDTEQWIHEELIERGFYHESSVWSVETFDPDCKDVLFYLLEQSNLTEGEW